ncbi:MAG: hypothetical protein IJI43_04195 [Bacilli bacterium]|nr:hypothetical protein [Bacilli bacterium]
MEENKEYLNEQTNQKVKKGINIIGLIAFIIGAIMTITGIVLVLVGFLGFADDGGHSKFAMFIIGGFVMVFGFAIAGFGWQALFIGHIREIQAYTTQQAMPVAKEGLEKIAPAVGEVAKEVTKGIEEGKKETNDD